MNGNLIDILQKQMCSFSKSHKRLATYIVNNYDKAAFMTASRLGQAVNVSESTVIRFAGMLGYDGYPELQDALLKTAHNKMTVGQRLQVTKNRIGSSDVLAGVLQADMDKIRLTLEKTDSFMFDKVIDCILRAEHIYIMGVRSSSALAEFLGFYLNLMFDNVKTVGTSGVTEVYEQVLHIKKEDVIICISYPRYSNRTIKAMRFAGLRGANVIAITDDKTSPLCACANYSLFAKSDMTSFVDSLVAPLSLINAIIAAIAIKKENDLTNVLQELEDIWDENQVYDEES